MAYQHKSDKCFDTNQACIKSCLKLRGTVAAIFTCIANTKLIISIFFLSLSGKKSSDGLRLSVSKETYKRVLPVYGKRLKLDIHTLNQVLLLLGFSQILPLLTNVIPFELNMYYCSLCYVSTNLKEEKLYLKTYHLKFSFSHSSKIKQKPRMIDS